MFGFCQDTTCLICPHETTEKIGNYDACFPSTDKSIPGCELVHWHSKNTLCFTTLICGKISLRLFVKLYEIFNL